MIFIVFYSTFTFSVSIYYKNLSCFGGLGLFGIQYHHYYFTSNIIKYYKVRFMKMIFNDGIQILGNY